MTATKPLDMPLPLVLKQEKEENPSEDEAEEDNEEMDSDSVSSLPQPSILNRGSLNDVDPRNEFLRLTSMVRRVYFSYLNKSIINNYNVCCKTSEARDISRVDLKKFASQMELQAVRASLEASLYRQAMLKIISEVKTSTSRQKIHKKLSIFLQTPPSTVDAAVQTIEDTLPEAKVFPPVEDEQPNERPKVETGEVKSLDERLTRLFSAPEEPPVNPADGQGPAQRDQEGADEAPVKVEPMEITKVEVQDAEAIATDDKGPGEGLNSLDASVNGPIEEDQTSQDSLMQHLEDMFCESDDSSDLTTLIERHSGVTKTNIDKEIMKMCPGGASPVKTPSAKSVSKTPDSSLATPPASLPQETPLSSSKRKLSFYSYKNKRRAVDGGEELQEDKETKKMRGIWLVERIHQVSKLRTKMTELSVRNYRKHGRIRSKFAELFGDDDGEDLAPDSPIRIEDHLTSCKERIAPWVVKYLMPFYSRKKVIKDRLLFKAVAKHISDGLIIENTFPEEEYVNQYIKDYFRNKPSIKSQADIYL
ncbi:uncharacterized protein LOC107043928 [Diachasma alloeum]|uniref:uncharacterized protein LOC107043928 n=1 Tax=Diachasma alloeum TaxID=454923 RepID=UPI0007385027|nr:uncharacterized protein LOC107043928 [Diachasma alloeum]